MNSTVADNTTQNSGGAINSAITATSIIIAGNTGYDLSGVGHNLNFCLFDSEKLDPAIDISNSSDIVINNSFDVDGDNPYLGLLADNGGYPTIALLAGSLAFDNGSNPNAETTDVRGNGFNQVIGNGIDIGAHENQAPTITAASDPSVVIMSEDNTPTAWAPPSLTATDPDQHS